MISQSNKPFLNSSTAFYELLYEIFHTSENNLIADIVKTREFPYIFLETTVSRKLLRKVTDVITDTFDKHIMFTNYLTHAGKAYVVWTVKTPNNPKLKNRLQFNFLCIPSPGNTINVEFTSIFKDDLGMLKGDPDTVETSFTYKFNDPVSIETKWHQIFRTNIRRRGGDSIKISEEALPKLTYSSIEDENQLAKIIKDLAANVNERELESVNEIFPNLFSRDKLFGHLIHK